MKIGILADTHGLLRPETLAALAGCEAILHAGDIDQPRVLDALTNIAPVYAVRGNNDGAWAASLPVLLDRSFAGVRVCMAHRRAALPADLTGFGLAVCGHTHQYEAKSLSGTLLLNPGSCGPRRFRLPVTLALAELSDGQIAVTRVDLTRSQPPAVNPGDMRRIVEQVMRETARGRAPSDIARRLGIDSALAEQIARLYVTHPGVTADGILAKMGL